MEYQLIAPIDPNKTIVEQILTNRGIPLEEVPHYLNATKEDEFSPLLLKNIEEGAQLLFKHLLKGHVYIQIDEDVDGYTSSAILLNYLHLWGKTIVESKISYDFHEGKGHGIVVESIPPETTLVVAIDGGANEYEIHKNLRERGIEVLILDHHHADQESPYACVIDNQLCDYPNKALCGAGIVYKFCQYLDSKFNVNYADNFLDLVALGLTADMMDVKSIETIYLIHEGYKQIRNPFIKGMVEKNEFKLGTGIPTPIDMAFYVAPYINAMARTGTKEQKKVFFESLLVWKANELIPSTKRGEKGKTEMIVTQAIRTCINVKNHQMDMRDENMTNIENLIKEQDLLSRKVLMVLMPSECPINSNLSGLVANELSNKYQRPTLILNEKTNEEGDKIWIGSARGYEKSRLKDFRTFCENSGLLEFAQGHGNAFGFSILDSHVKDFIEYCETTLKDIDFSLSYNVDFIYSGNNFKPQDILSISELKHYWGTGLNEAKVALEGIAVTADNLKLMSPDRNPTLKITLSNGVSCIKFKSSEEEFNELFSESGCVVINLVGRCESNEYNGLITPQILIENYDIVNRQKYYF